MASGRWDFNFTVISNTCSYYDPVGTVIPFSYGILESGTSNGYIRDGENAGLYDQLGQYLTAVKLRWPTLSGSYVNRYGDSATLTLTFLSATRAIADFTIQGSCSAYATDR